jgi:hypothetical protein
VITPARRLAAVSCLAALLAATPQRVATWGFDVHRLVTDGAIDLLPEPIRPFFDTHRAFVVEHSIDPDLWRSAGFTEEPPRHFLDLDAYGAPPFDALPRDYDAAVARYGREAVEKNGTLPWRGEEIYGKLVRAFEDQRKGTGAYALDNIKFFTAILSHYAADAHVPLHSVINYDGQLTNQHGVHSRLETEAVLRFRHRLALKPVARAPITTPRAYFFDVLLESFEAVAPSLEADRLALGNGTEYDNAYFERFFVRVKPILENRLASAMSGVAALVSGAWEQGGRPDLPLNPQRPVRKKRTQ